MSSSKRMTRSEVFAALVVLAATCAWCATGTAATSSTGKRPVPLSTATTVKAASTAKPAPSAKSIGTVPPASAAKSTGSAATAPTVKATKPAETADDSPMTLKGGQEGTVFRSLTVEGEDRIHFEVERPELRLEIDPQLAPGLEWGTARDVLDRTIPDTMTPLLAGTATEASPYTGRPWLSHFAAGAVARFRPAVEGVESWKLTVANWRGEPVTTFRGKGDPPREIAWDGRAANGAAVMPGRTYSYVFEAVDRAGNRRNFVGEGFRVSAFRVASEQSTTLVFTSGELTDRSGASAGGSLAPAGPPPVILEAASWLNQSAAPATPIVVTATGRSAEEAAALAQRVQQQLGALLIGDTARMRTESRVESDAPPGGAVALVAGRTAVATPGKK